LSQREFTHVIDKANLAALEASVDKPTTTSREKIAWKQLDVFSGKILTTLPTYCGRVPNIHFTEMVARFLLIPSPILMDDVGKNIYGCIRSATHLCDPFGDRLIGTSMRCRGWDDTHDSIRDFLYNMCQARRGSEIAKGAGQPLHFMRP